MNQQEISLYEELQRNAFPALQDISYDGWSIRFGGGFTYRVNCANPMYSELLSMAEKINYVESLYQASGLKMAIFKLHEGMDPARIQMAQSLLDEKGYATERHGNIFVCDLNNFCRQTVTPVIVDTTISDKWLNGFLTMNGTSEEERAAAEQMLKNIHFPILATSIVENGKMIACGLGVIERGHVGLYDIYVDASCRRRGLGADICTAIMRAGREQRCSTAYLQVLSDNLGARAMYYQLGYDKTYAYWFRTKHF